MFFAVKKIVQNFVQKLSHFQGYSSLVMSIARFGSSKLIVVSKCCRLKASCLLSVESFLSGTISELIEDWD